MGKMRLGVVSDSHGHIGLTQAAIRMLAACEVEQVIHCGDIGSPAIVALFEAWPTHFVLGNVDDDSVALKQAIEEAGQSWHGRFGQLELAGRKIAFLHSDDGVRFRAAIESGKYDLVCYGHTHQAEIHNEGTTAVLNPGALYRAQPHSLALVELPELQITHVEL